MSPQIRKIILSIIAIIGLFLITSVLTNNLLYKVAFLITPHAYVSTLIGCPIPEGCGYEAPSIYTYLLYYGLLVIIIFIYALIVAKLFKIEDKKDFLRVFAYSLLSIIIICFIMILFWDVKIIEIPTLIYYLIFYPRDLHYLFLPHIL